ncbi:MAG: transporter [Nitrospirales bacterium]|nr:transporter [Nitrospirales bacterium]
MEFLISPSWAEVTREEASEKPEQEDRRQEAEEAARLRDLFLRQEKVFIRKGEFLGEINTFYNTDEATVFATGNAGTLVAGQVQSRTTELTLIGRYGLWDGLEIDLIVPVFVHARQQLNIGTLAIDRKETGIGDVSAALRYQLIGERGGIPDVILDINAISDTGGDNLRGTGNWSIGTGITFVKTIDPVVLFGRVGYTWTLAAEDDLSDIELTPVRVTRNPGDIIQYRVGMGFSLNDRVSFNLAVNGAVVGSSKIDGRKQRNSNLELLTLVLSTTVLVTKQLFVEPVVGVGLTDDAFDTFVGIRFPYRF